MAPMSADELFLSGNNLAQPIDRLRVSCSCAPALGDSESLEQLPLPALVLNGSCSICVFLFVGKGANETAGDALIDA